MKGRDVIARLRYGTAEWRLYLDGLARHGGRRPAIERAVAGVLRDVRRSGESALVELTRRFDRVALTPATLRVPPARIRAAARKAAPELRDALATVAGQIEAFHRRQLDRGFRIRLRHGGVLEERVHPLDSVGVYVPGGAGAYPSSVLMNVIPARVAGVPRIVVATPPRTLEKNPAVAAALVLAGVEEHVLGLGGAQAIAALAYGTKRVPAVAKIVGPGNAYVAEAKRQVRGTVEIDNEAGPSEVVVLADDTADPGFVAVDLLAQAEHGSGEERVVLVTPSEALIDEVFRLLAEGIPSMANPAATRRALRRQGALLRVRDLEQGVAAVNALAPEHAEVQTRAAATWARRLLAGAVFVGHHTPVAVGDYGIGPNHVLPTGGTARRASPLSVRDFQRRSSLVQLSHADLLQASPSVVSLALAEGFPGHAQSVLTRLEER